MSCCPAIRTVQSRTAKVTTDTSRAAVGPSTMRGWLGRWTHLTARCVSLSPSFLSFQLLESVHHEEQTAVRDHLGLVHECGRARRAAPTGRTKPETIRTRRRRLLNQIKSLFSKPSSAATLLVSLCFPFCRSECCRCSLFSFANHFPVVAQRLWADPVWRLEWSAGARCGGEP